MLETVYLVDDNPIFLLTAKKMFQLLKAGNGISTFKNGLEALNRLKRLNETGKKMPDLILLDINMPVMNGWNFLDALRKEKITGLNIYLLSSSIDPVDIQRAASYKELKGYLTKPLTLDTLKYVIDKLID